MDTDSFIIRIFTENIFENIAGDVERWFDTSHHSDTNNKIPLPIGKKKVYGFFKDELEGKIMKEFCALTPKAYAYLMDDDSEKKKAQGTKKCVIKHSIMFKDYEDCLFNNKIILKSQPRFKSDHQRYML